jgi:hypothetical protein
MLWQLVFYIFTSRWWNTQMAGADSLCVLRKAMDAAPAESIPCLWQVKRCITGTQMLLQQCY